MTAQDARGPKPTEIDMADFGPPVVVREEPEPRQTTKAERRAVVSALADLLVADLTKEKAP